MKTFNIPVIWESWGLIQITAETLEEAKEKVFAVDAGLPHHPEYIDDSLMIDEEGIAIHNQLEGDNEASL